MRLQRDFALTLIDRLVARGDVAVDVGANRGVYTRKLQLQVGGSGQVWAIEPYPPSVAALQRIWRHDGNVRVCAAAASDGSGQADLHVPVVGRQRIHALASLHSPDAAHATVTVALRTLDELVSARTRSVTFLYVEFEVH